MTPAPVGRHQEGLRVPSRASLSGNSSITAVVDGSRMWQIDLPSALGDAIYTDDEVDFIERAGMGDCERKRAWFPRSRSPPSEGFYHH